MVRFNEEKKVNEIAIVEIFKSIDGEGFHAGQATVFVRTLGCNLRCAWCDSAYTFSEEQFKEAYGKDIRWMTVEEIFEEVDKLETYTVKLPGGIEEREWEYKSICLTGGEPLMEVNKEFVTELIHKFIDADYAVNVETNGSIDYKYWRDEFPIPEEVRGDLYGNRVGMMSLITDWKLPHSKMNKLMNNANLIEVLTPFDLVKCVVSDDPEDWRELERLVKVCVNAKIYISPCFGEVTMSKLPEFVMNHPNVVCQLQQHKIFWSPDTLGV